MLFLRPSAHRIYYLNLGDLNVNHATWRTLDPAIGRWWQSDPLAEVDRSFSPYNSMWASPMNFSDPDGDCPTCWGAFWNAISAHILPEATITATGIGVGVGTASSVLPTAFELLPGVLFGLPNVLLPEVTVTAQAPNDLWRVNGQYYTQHALFETMRSPTDFGNQVLKKMDISAQQAFLRHDIHAATAKFVTGYVVPTVNYGSMVMGGFGLAQMTYGLARGGFKYMAWRVAGKSGNVLRHYTSEAGYMAILRSKTLNPSLGIKNARYGPGQYLTDLTSEGLTSGQVSRRLFGVPWNGRKVSHFIDIDVRGLNVIKNGPNNFLVPGTNGLPLGNRIVNHGATIFR